MADKSGYLTWNTTKGSKEKAFAAAASAYDNMRPIARGSYYQPFKNVTPNTSIRDGFNRVDYNQYRPDEETKTERSESVTQAYESYDHLGVVQNIIDLMVDFVVQDMHLVHSVRPQQRFYEAWWSKVNGVERSERFTNSLLLSARTIVQREVAKITPTQVKTLKKGQVIGAKDIPVKKNEIPIQYTFHNPLSVKALGGQLGIFSGKPKYGLKIPKDVAAKVKSPQNDIEKQMVAEMAPEIVNAIRRGVTEIPLDEARVSVYHYRKNDWESWGKPMLQSVMSDLITLSKLRLADQVALDGAISHIRIWKLGSLEHKIIPNEAVMSRLADQLLNNVGGGAMDLIWGPELELQETSTDLHKFLGKEKYVPTLEAIYSGLGIPATLTGSGGSSGGYTNNFVGLQTLLERLKYVRNILVEFWEKEIAIVQKAMGYAKPAIVKFSKMTLSDEAAIKTLILNMYDRNIISLETAQEILGEDTDLERARMSRESKQRESGLLPRKAGPWNNPEHEEGLEKIALQSGQATPSQVGLDLEKPKNGEKKVIDIEAKKAAETQKGIPGQGRPVSKKDSTKRKKKRVLPRSKAEFVKAFNWARNTQGKIAEILEPIWLEVTAKKNMRSLSDLEAEQIEDLKFAVLSQMTPFQEVTEENVTFLAQSQELCINSEVDSLFKRAVADLGNKITLNEIREIQAQSYVLSLGEE